MGGVNQKSLIGYGWQSVCEVLCFCALCVSATICGCGGQHDKASRDDGRGKRTIARVVGFREVGVFLPTNVLSGKPWEVGTPSPGEALAALERNVPLKEGTYDLWSLCKAIEHETGRRIAWFPAIEPPSPRGQGIWDTFIFRRKKPGEEHLRTSGREWLLPAKPKLHEVLDAILEATNHLPAFDLETRETIYGGDPYDTKFAPRTWVAIVLQKRILLVLWPDEFPDCGKPDTSKGENEPVSDGE